MKEAFTKALGVGMHCDFKSFDISLDTVDNESVWAHVSSGDQQNGFHFKGLVNFVSEKKSSDEWDVSLYPIYRYNAIKGIACIFIAHSSLTNGTRCAFEVEWTNMTSLVQTIEK